MAVKPLNTHPRLERKETLSLDEVFPLVDLSPLNTRFGSKVKKELKGDSIKMNSLRLQLFLTKGTICVSCGLAGSFFAKEKNPNDQGFHLNLYALNSQGEEVLMTKDHIQPKSKGGKDLLENLQVMCKVCNKLKGNTES